jgi:ethanolamine utilization protein EutA
LQLARPAARIRATVIGAAQYTVQVSGSTIFVSPLETLPLRNVPVIAPALPLDDEKIDPAAVATAIRSALKRRELDRGDSAVAVFVPWRGSATFQRLDDVCRGILDGLAAILAHGHPIVLVGDSDVGGLIGIHFCEEMKVATPIVSIDGLELKDFDYIDIGAILDTSGAVAVVIKSLVFPASADAGRDWQLAPGAAAAVP